VDTVSAELGLDVDALVEAALSDAAGTSVAADAEEALGDTLTMLATGEEWSAGGARAGMEAVPTGVSADADGVTVTFQTTATLDDWLVRGENGGSLTGTYAAPSWGSLSGNAALAMSVNTANQILYQKWGGGQFSIEATGEDLSIDMTTFSSMLPGIDALVLAVEPTFPPMVVPQADGTYAFTLSDFRFLLYDDAVIEGTQVYEIYVSAYTDGEFRTSGDMLDVTWGRPDAYVDIERAPEGANLEFLQSTLESLFAGLFLNDSEYLSGMPLPSIGDYSVAVPVVSADGAEGGYVVASGDFSAP
jgi:hypothetical protein